MIGDVRDQPATAADPATVLYLDPWAGVSGDMLLGALLDCDRTDALEGEFRRTVAALGLPEATVDVIRDNEWGVTCTRVQVHSDDHAPLRHLPEMEEIIQGAALSERVTAHSLAAVRRLASVEAAVHGCAVEEIHFHEVGAVDTLVDIVGALALVEALGIDEVRVGPIPVGGGTVEIAHGRMGVPAPATTVLLEGYPVIGGPEMKELTTPTGALLVGELQAIPGPVPGMCVEKVGHGAGSMTLDGGPNILRALVGPLWSHSTAEDLPGGGEDQVVELQTNLDDVSPEIVGHACGMLREAGALDVWTVPVYMKKNRPGVIVHALVRPEDEAAAVETLFSQTGTLGIRRQAVTRRLADRGVVTVEIAGAGVRVKWGRRGDRLVSLTAEYEDAAAAAAASGLPLKDVLQAAAAAASLLLTSTAR